MVYGAVTSGQAVTGFVAGMAFALVLFAVCALAMWVAVNVVLAWWLQHDGRNRDAKKRGTGTDNGGK